jgi:hypothetical protein
LARERQGDPPPVERADEVVDYTVADQAPGLRPAGPWRKNPRHDAVLRARLDRQNSGLEEGPQLATWDEISSEDDTDDRSVMFYPAEVTTNPFYRGREARSGSPDFRGWMGTLSAHVQR